MDNYETRHAIREANKIELEDAYFNARPQLDFKVNRNIFGAGFDRAWDKQSENSAKLEQKRDELQLERDNYKSVAEAHSGAFQECIRLREQRNDLLAALKRLWLSCPTGLECNNFHHAKRDQHDFNQECGPAAEYLAAIEQADATISKVQK